MLIDILNNKLMETTQSFKADRWKTIMVPAGEGELRMLHHRPSGNKDSLPIFFLPGWGTLPEGFSGFLHGVEGKTECFYFETREKNSSRLDRRRAHFSMEEHARDLAAALKAAGLAEGRPFVLCGTCWGASVAAWAIASGAVAADRILLFDPMDRLWFPQWILDWLLPLIPLAFWQIIRPAGKAIALHGMKEEVQRRRISGFIDSAELWKWKKASRAARRFSFTEIAGSIPGEVWVINGVNDKVHDASIYPRLAARIPGGRFLHIPSDEALREELIASVSLAFARLSTTAGPPPSLAPFEITVRDIRPVTDPDR